MSGGGPSQAANCAPFVGSTVGARAHELANVEAAR